MPKNSEVFDVNVIKVECENYNLTCRLTFFPCMVSSHKDGYDKYMAWKRVWTSNGKTEPSPKAFMADQQLPYWVRRDAAVAAHRGAMMLRCGKSSRGHF